MRKMILFLSIFLTIGFSGSPCSVEAEFLEKLKQFCSNKNTQNFRLDIPDCMTNEKITEELKSSQLQITIMQKGKSRYLLVNHKK